MFAASGRGAAVGRADLVVIAIQRLARHAFAKRTGVALGARVAVAAASTVRNIDATLGAVAGVVGAGVAVHARDFASGQTFAGAARVANCADATIVAGRGVVGMFASRGRVAAVGRAQIAVVAGQRLAWLATAGEAAVAVGTSICVRAGQVVGQHDTARTGVTRIVCARIAVSAARLAAWQAFALRARIAHCTHAAVAAGGRAVGVHTTGTRVATVGSADVVVVAIKRQARMT